MLHLPGNRAQHPLSPAQHFPSFGRNCSSSKYFSLCLVQFRLIDWLCLACKRSASDNRSKHLQVSFPIKERAPRPARSASCISMNLHTCDAHRLRDDSEAVREIAVPAYEDWISYTETFFFCSFPSKDYFSYLHCCPETSTLESSYVNNLLGLGRCFLSGAQRSVPGTDVCEDGRGAQWTTAAPLLPV